MFRRGAVVSRTRKAFQGIREVTRVQIMFRKVVVSSTNRFFDGIRLVIFQIRVKFFQFEGSFFRPLFNPGHVDGGKFNRRDLGVIIWRNVIKTSSNIGEWR